MLLRILCIFFYKKNLIEVFGDFFLQPRYDIFDQGVLCVCHCVSITDVVFFFVKIWPSHVKWVKSFFIQSANVV